MAKKRVRDSTEWYKGILLCSAAIYMYAYKRAHQAIRDIKPDTKATTIVETMSAADASCGALAFAEAAEDGEDVEEDVGEDVPPAVSVAPWTRYTIATMETPT